jgi:menaquinone-specific isochorismate synthase
LPTTLPSDVLLQLKHEREKILHRAEAENRPLTWNEQKELFNWYSERVDAFLDSGQGDTWLKRADIAALVSAACVISTDSAIHFWPGW